MHRFTVLLALTVTATAFAQTTPADPDANAPAASPAQNRQPKQLPPPGVAIPDADRAELSAAVAGLGKEIAALELAKLAGGMDALIPDVEVFHKAVDWALRYDEFYNVKEVATARTLLAEGKSRATALKDGKAPWTAQTGLVVRGYRSKIDGSVQPFGVVVPATWKGTADKTPRATWIWNHGRGETLSELSFIAGRMKSAGEFTPADTFVVHPYGRYCNATKFAGEVDVFEALDSAKKSYPVDSQRLVNAGFSMGGASAWHLAVHHSGLWAASHAGAGFAETAEYAGVFAPGKTPPPWWEVILYRWYDATVCAGNLANHPMFAYHGSEDKQGQATQIMKRFAEKEGVKIEEFVGPGVGHKYEAGVKSELLTKFDAAAKVGRERFPLTVKLVSYSTRDAVSHWVSIQELERHWERAELTAEIRDGVIFVTSKNVARFYLEFPYYYVSGRNAAQPINEVRLNGEILTASTEGLVCAGGMKRQGKWTAWEVGTRPKPTSYDGFLVYGWLSPRPSFPHGRTKSQLRGPIDDAFMDQFVFVRPTGEPLSPTIGQWCERELAHATKQWRGIFRGEVQIVDDTLLAGVGGFATGMASHKDDVSGPRAILFNSHLVLWGDPSSNAVIKRIADKLPVKWTADGLVFGGKKYSANHVPVLIFPNPLNPAKYVVLNSGFTFSRAASSGTNSQQTPKLPDWAIVDISVPPDDKFPGKIADAGFFDEQWKFTAERPK